MFELRLQFEFLSGGGDGVNKADQIASLVNGGLNAREAVMIGDRRFDIEAAKAHSLPDHWCFLGIRCGWRTRAGRR